jgi:hypothetical protein
LVGLLVLEEEDREQGVTLLALGGTPGKVYGASMGG